MWLFALVHLVLIIFGFAAGSLGWWCALENIESKTCWWVGGVAGSLIGWFIAHKIMEHAHQAFPPAVAPGPIPLAAKAVQGGNLTPCPDCGRMLSPLAPACPQCGRPTKPESTL
jgi:uncharacterized protein YneF (UPF0154 family)